MKKKNVNNIAEELTSKEKIIRRKFNFIIDEHASNARAYMQDPSTNFTRDCVWHEDLITRVMIMMGGAHDLFDDLEHICGELNIEQTSNEGFAKALDKLKLSYFVDLANDVIEEIPCTQKYEGYTIWAVDATHIRKVDDPDDGATRVKEYNEFQLTAIFDVENQTYKKFYLSEGPHNEVDALIEMLTEMHNNGKIPKKTIIVADRRYESYKLIHFLKSIGVHFVIRTKDIRSSKSMLRTCEELPKSGEFDKNVCKTITLIQTQEFKLEHKNCVYRTRDKFDYPEDSNFYELKFRALRVCLSRGHYACFITDLNKKAFRSIDIKELYHKRWRIETSFNAFKHLYGVGGLHFRRNDRLLKEIVCKSIAFNYCNWVANSVSIPQLDTKYKYHIDMTKAVTVFKQCFLKNKSRIKASGLVKRCNLIPYIDDRYNERILRTIAAASFNGRKSA